MTPEEYNKASLLKQILYDTTGMLAENHPSIVEAMELYADQREKEAFEAGHDKGFVLGSEFPNLSINQFDKNLTEDYEDYKAKNVS